MEVTDLRPGDIMCGPIDGFIPGVIPVAAGQLATAPLRHVLTWRTWWGYRHSATVTKAAVAPDDGLWGISEWPLIGQAMPRGFEEVPLHPDQWNDRYLFIRPAYQPGQADEVARHAQQMARRRVRYGWADYAAIPAHRWHIPVPHLDAFISATDADGYPRRAICSQAVDAQLALAGFHLFTDGRLFGDVTPAGLYLRLLELVPEALLPPGGNIVRRPVEFGGVPRRLL